ncbi:hypothetical protein KCU98_g126, partial [Aureobasidium melanogenum]
MRAIGFIFTPYSWRVASLASSPESCIASAHDTLVSRDTAQHQQWRRQLQTRRSISTYHGKTNLPNKPGINGQLVRQILSHLTEDVPTNSRDNIALGWRCFGKDESGAILALIASFTWSIVVTIAMSCGCRELSESTPTKDHQPAKSQIQVAGR